MKLKEVQTSHTTAVSSALISSYCREDSGRDCACQRACGCVRGVACAHDTLIRTVSAARRGAARRQRQHVTAAAFFRCVGASCTSPVPLRAARFRVAPAVAAAVAVPVARPAGRRGIRVGCLTAYDRFLRPSGRWRGGSGSSSRRQHCSAEACEVQASTKLRADVAWSGCALTIRKEGNTEFML